MKLTAGWRLRVWLLTAVLAAGLAAPSFADLAPRNWTCRGHYFGRAAYVGVEEYERVLLRPPGWEKMIRVPLTSLSSEDLDWIRRNHPEALRRPGPAYHILPVPEWVANGFLGGLLLSVILHHLSLRPVQRPAAERMCTSTTTTWIRGRKITRKRREPLPVGIRSGFVSCFVIAVLLGWWNEPADSDHIQALPLVALVFWLLFCLLAIYSETHLILSRSLMVALVLLAVSLGCLWVAGNVLPPGWPFKELLSATPPGLSAGTGR